jgi:hypothetical protein
MLHRKLGNTGIAVSKIALGTMYFGSETLEEDAFAILDTFVEAGGNSTSHATRIVATGWTSPTSASSGFSQLTSITWVDLV